MPTRRVFTYAEARELLPAVVERTRRAVAEMTELGGEEDDDSDEDGAERVLLAWAGDLQAMGLEVKGRWLVDFDSGDGFWCWKWPEEDLLFFHSYEDGFKGRVRIQ